MHLVGQGYSHQALNDLMMPQQLLTRVSQESMPKNAIMINQPMYSDSNGAMLDINSIGHYAPAQGNIGINSMSGQGKVHPHMSSMLG